MFFTVILFIFSGLMFLSLHRVLVGPSIFDRLTGLALVSTKTLVLILLIGFQTGQLEFYIDIALTYGLIGFVGPLVLAKFFENHQNNKEDHGTLR